MGVYEHSPEGVVAWLRSDAWQNGGADETWAYYADALAKDIERDFPKVSRAPRGAGERDSQ